MSSSSSDILVSAPWVHENLDKIKVFDCSWYLPFMARNTKEEFVNAHIPGAKFFDIDEIKDQTKLDLPHMVPTPEFFGAAMDRFGVGAGDHVVVYDSAGVGPACRVYWTFQAMGHPAGKVSVLNGGMPEWAKCGFPTESGASMSPSQPADPHKYRARPVAGVVCDYTHIVGAIERLKTSGGADGAQIVDARPAGRFTGKEPEFRPGLPSGHMPWARNVPFTEVTAPAAAADPQVLKMKSPEAIRRLFTDAGVDLARPIITTCGSGVTASVLYVALLTAGVPKDNLTVYDGSWTEYALNPHSEIAVD
ncbi:hypothetical protein GGI11_003876 [Coemansia sp. RSA 2049]|nr:hypothetical protein GGI11_003876 [Coemansia sp. RSA 2049]